MDYVKECRRIERELKDQGWGFHRETSQTVIVVPESFGVRLNCKDVKNVAHNVFDVYCEKNEVCFGDRLSRMVCRRSSSGMIVLEDMPNVYDMEKFETYEESREGDFGRYSLVTEIAKGILALDG